MLLSEVDENKPIGYELPDKEFLQTREAIMELMVRLVKPGSGRWSSMDIMQHLIDETVTDIAYIWRPR